MTIVRLLLPQERETTVEEVIKLFHSARRVPLGIGHEVTLRFCANLSQRLLQDERTKAFPELAALGFWLRGTSVQRMLQDHLPPEMQTYRAPLGVVFQLPPGNVPIFFLYSAIISLLCGNVTVVRLSGKDAPSRALLIEILSASLEATPEALRKRLVLLRYNRDDVVTAAFSSFCDLRLIWGGDATIEHIRGVSLPPLASEIGFGDRFSASAINAKAFLEADDSSRATLTRHFYNDLFWFDQFACASPRLLAWIGTASDVERAGSDFYNRLSREAENKNTSPLAGASLAKLNMAYLALHDLAVMSYKIHSPSLTTIALCDLSALSPFKRVNYGFGLLLTVRLDMLDDLAVYAERRDQTLTVWGISKNMCEAFAAQCQGRGFDRIVPVGQALDFNPIWDGHNLFAAMTRLVQIL